MYDENKAKRAVTFINALKHTKANGGVCLLNCCRGRIK